MLTAHQKQFCILLMLWVSIPRLVHGFDLQTYYASRSYQDRDTFIKRFPYQAYLQQVAFTDFATLQQHRTFLWRKIGDGDDFLYYLGEYFMNYYPPDLAYIMDTIVIGEAYIGPKTGLNAATNEIYQIIGYYILSKAAQKIEQEIKKGNFDPETPENQQIIQRLEQNKVYVTIERGTWGNVVYNFKQGKWDYILNRVWLKSKEVGQEGVERYDRALGDDFFTTYFEMEVPPPLPPDQVNLKLAEYRKDYPLGGSNDFEVFIFTMHDQSAIRSPQIGYAVWLKRPQLNASYFAYQNVTQKYQQWAARNRRQVILATTGGFTNIHHKPEGLTVEEGTIVNAVLMPDRHGLVIVQAGGIRVINLKNPTIRLPLTGRQALDIDNPLTSLIAYSKLLDWCKKQQATVFQTQLLAFSNQLLIDVSKARGQLRERRILALVSDQHTKEVHHIVFDIPTSYNLAVIAKDIFDLLLSRNKKVEAILNLDVGSYNILNVFDPRGNVLSNPKGPVHISNATNLIVYTR